MQEGSHLSDHGCNAHRGTASLVLSVDGHTLSGDYYSGRERQNYGSLHLEKLKAPRKRGTHDAKQNETLHLEPPE